MKKLTKAQEQRLLARELPDFNFDYSGDDYAKAYEDKMFRDAVREFNPCLPALKYYLKTGEHDTLNKFGISIRKILNIKHYLSEITAVWSKK